MKRIKFFWHRFKWLLLVASLLTVGLWMNWQVVQYGRGLVTFTFMQYVADEYMPAHRRLTKKWPADLSGLPRYVKSDKHYTPTDDRLNRVLKYYSENFGRLEVIQSDRQSYTYRLHLKNQTVTCESTVNPDGGGCK